MKKKFILLVISSIGLISICLSSFANSNDGITMSLSSNRLNLNVGDELKIFCCIENHSDKSFRFLYSPTINIVNEDGKGFLKYTDWYIDPKLEPDESDFFILNPGESKTFSYSYSLENGKKEINQKQFEGYFLNDYIYTFILGREKQIFIRGNYRMNFSDYKVGVEKYGLNNLYKYDLESNVIKIQIK